MSDDPRRWRQLTVWLHVLTSVGWMSLALVLLALLVLARVDGGPTALAATAMADHLDITLLAPLANARLFPCASSFEDSTITGTPSSSGVSRYRARSSKPSTPGMMRSWSMTLGRMVSAVSMARLGSEQ